MAHNVHETNVMSDIVISVRWIFGLAVGAWGQLEVSLQSQLVPTKEVIVEIVLEVVSTSERFTKHGKKEPRIFGVVSSTSNIFLSEEDGVPHCMP